MSERPFRLAITLHGRPELLRLAPPTPELYEELCRAEVERIVLGFAGEPPQRSFTNAAVELCGEYPATRIRISGTLSGRPALHELELYRPRFHRMRHGRLRTPDAWGQAVTYMFYEPLGWLWPDHTDDGLLRQHLHEMTGSFGGGFKRRPIQVIGDPPDQRAHTELATASGDVITVEADLCEDGVRRATWRIAEDLRAAAYRAIDAEPTPEQPDLSSKPDLEHLRT